MLPATQEAFSLENKYLASTSDNDSPYAVCNLRLISQVCTAQKWFPERNLDHESMPTL